MQHKSLFLWAMLAVFVDVGLFAAGVPVSGLTAVGILEAAGGLLLWTNGKAAEQRLAEEKKLTALIAHELKTPAAVMQSYADELLRWALADPDQAKKAAAAIAEEAEDLSALVDRILFLDRAEKTADKAKRTDVTEVLRQTLLEFGRRDSARNYIWDGDPVTAQVDPSVVKELARILLGNAGKFTPAGGAVRLSCTENGDGFYFTVEDSGTGLPAADLKRLTEPGFTEKAPDGTIGNGLGLFIAAKLLKMAGGRLQAGTSPMGGAAFTCLFKRKE